MLRDTYITVDLDRLAENIRKIRSRIGDKVAMAAVVKADAYGHGSVECAPTIMENGADYLAVATLTEALELRRAYPDYPIFIMGYTSDENLPVVVRHDITQCIFTEEQALCLNRLGEEMGKRPKVHIKYDTGFHRIGFADTPESIEAIKRIVKLPCLDCEGIFSHFALTDDQENHRQYEAFMAAVHAVEEDGFHFRYRHICDSISAIDYPEFRLDMVRPGAILYGMKSFRTHDIDIHQVISFRTRISHLQHLKAGEGLSYNYKYRVSRDSVVATIQAGYADGYPRNMSGAGEVTVRGKRVPVIGVLCMDQCMIDVTDVPDVQVGDEVILYGDEADNAVTFQEASKMGATNKNELLCRFTRRTPKLYLKGGKVVKVRNELAEGFEENWEDSPFTPADDFNDENRPAAAGCSPFVALDGSVENKTEKNDASLHGAGYRPLIAVMGAHGISALNNGTIKVPYAGLNEAYSKAVLRAGGIPVVIPPMDEEAMLRILDSCDGLLLPGGEDVDPAIYGEGRSEKLGRTTIEYDRAWKEAFLYARQKKMPVLGICRGLQLINAALGGTLYQDLSEIGTKTLVHGQKAERSCPTHTVSIDKDSHLAGILGGTSVETNSMHHQCVKVPGEGLAITAYAGDGVVEGMENADGKVILVQWHPEELQDSVPCMRGLFEDLIRKASGSDLRK